MSANRTRAGGRAGTDAVACPRLVLSACVAGLSLVAAGCVPSATVSPQPGPAAAGPTPQLVPEYFVYIVQPDDTLGRLGVRFGVPWEQIADENHLSDPDVLTVGQVLLIPRMEGVEVPVASADPPPVRPDAPRRSVPVAELHRGNPKAQFWWPTGGSVIWHYGDALRGLPEPGIGISAPAGTEVCAVDAGTVITCIHVTGPDGAAWGNVAAIAHAGDWVSWYAYLGSVLVSRGQKVAKGDPIGTVGSTGAADLPQLAFRLFRNERLVDPEQRLP